MFNALGHAKFTCVLINVPGFSSNLPVHPGRKPSARELLDYWLSDCEFPDAVYACIALLGPFLGRDYFDDASNQSVWLHVAYKRCKIFEIGIAGPKHRNTTVGKVEIGLDLH